MWVPDPIQPQIQVVRIPQISVIRSNSHRKSKTQNITCSHSCLFSDVGMDWTRKGLGKDKGVPVMVPNRQKIHPRAPSTF